MAKLERKILQVFCGEAGTQQTSAFGTMKTDTPVYSRDPDILQTANWPQGWNNAVASDDAPFMEDMNTVQYLLSRAIAYLNQCGIAEYHPDQDYYAQMSFCQVAGVVYGCKADNNSTDPQDPTDQPSTYWVKMLDVNDAFVTTTDLTNAIAQIANTRIASVWKTVGQDGSIKVEGNTIGYVIQPTQNITFTLDEALLASANITGTYTIELRIYMPTDVFTFDFTQMGIVWMDNISPNLAEVGDYLLTIRKYRNSIADKTIGCVQGKVTIS